MPPCTAHQFTVHDKEHGIDAEKLKIRKYSLLSALSLDDDVLHSPTHRPPTLSYDGESGVHVVLCCWPLNGTSGLGLRTLRRPLILPRAGAHRTYAGDMTSANIELLARCTR